MQVMPWNQPGYAFALINLNSQREIVCELVYEAFDVPGFLDTIVTAIALLYGKGGDIGLEMSADKMEMLKNFPEFLDNVAKIANALNGNQQ